MMISFYAYCFHSGPNFDTREQVPRTPQMMCVDQLWAHSDFRFFHKSELISKISVKFELLIGHTILSYFFWCSLLTHLHSKLRFDQNQSTQKWMQNALLWAHSDFQFCYKLELLLSKINLYIHGEKFRLPIWDDRSWIVPNWDNL